MDTFPASRPPVTPAAVNATFDRAEEEIPLGWECANPALQIDSWRLEQDTPLSSKS